MRISEVSHRTGVSIRSLRYYEQKRLLCPGHFRMAIAISMSKPSNACKRSRCTWVLASPPSRSKRSSNALRMLLSRNHCQSVRRGSLALYQEKQQDIERQIEVLTALHARLTERITCLQRQLRTT